ncbi:hypothetical protein [Streptomyces thermolilacinus]|uniref:hypothetical protein n=1 Tax=Streptomyces thermolilacinus TaxID=285540 RepID=UPI00040F7522|nr:hypothetical protein [Streptomyces thermolilacinus]
MIRPETWFPLVRAAWTYINDFGPDILRSLDYWHRLQAEARPLSNAEADTRFTAWAADPENKVPVHQLTGKTTVNWQLLTFLIGFESRKMAFFTKQNRAGLARRAAAERLVAEGRLRTSLIDGLCEVTRPDDNRGPWHHSLQPRELAVECLALRNACYVFVAALSMMRDCEIREITKDPLTEYFCTPAVKSVKRKLDPDLPTAHWWIIAPVAQAIETALHLSTSDTLAFAAVTPRFHGRGFTSQTAITCFIKHVNRHRRPPALPRSLSARSPRTCSAGPWPCSPATIPDRESPSGCSSSTQPPEPWPTVGPRATWIMTPPGPASSTPPSPNVGSNG